MELCNFSQVIVLVLLCLVGLGSYFCYDAPVALEIPLKANLNLTQGMYNGLYYFYNYPNVIVCPLGGILVDTYLGKRWAGILFASLVMAGQFVTSWGTWVGELWIMDMGRFIFGLGGETLVTVQNAYCVSWYSGSILNLAMGVVLSVSRFGSVVSLNVLSTIYDDLEENNLNSTEPVSEVVVLGQTMVIASIFTILSLGAACCLAFTDFKFPPTKTEIDDKNDEVVSVCSEKSVVKLTFKEKMLDLKKKLTFPLGAWLIFAICVFYYSSIFPLISQGTEFYIVRYNVTEDTAVSLNSMPYLISLPAVPIFGALIDYSRHNVIWVLGSILMTLLSFVMMLIPAITAWVPVITLGLGYALLACGMWPMVSYLVDENQLGTAYGVMQAIQNLGLALTGQISGKLIDGFEDLYEAYQWLIVLFLVFQGICLVSILWLWQRHGVNCEPLGGGEGDQNIETVKQEIKEEFKRQEMTVGAVDNEGFDKSN